MEERYLYRYERGHAQSIFGTPYYSNATIYLYRHKVVKETSKGCWLENGKFVLNDAKKCYAYPTAEQALTNFIKRTEFCQTIQKAQLNKTVAFLDAAKLIVPNEADYEKYTFSPVF